MLLRDTPALPDPRLQPPTLAEAGDPFAALRVVHLLARIPRGESVRVRDVVDRLNGDYLDWSFSREVVIAVLGTVYAVGDEADAATLSQRLQSTTWPDGSPVFTLPMVFGLLIFYACCLQCAATLAVIRRETNSWRWPIFAWTYMTVLGYTGALLIYQIGSRL